MKKVLLAALLCVACASVARAQFNVGQGGGGGPGGAGGAHGSDAADDQDAETKAKIAAPPPAIPGARSAGDAVAPSSKVAAEMSPNDALFDAINRGDAGGARDALNRGAQLDAKNVLGQTPIDVAVDLNRNDITFLLLSMRGPATARAAPASAVPAHLVATPVSVPAASAAHRGHRRAIMVVTPPAAGAAAMPASPAASDSGAPNPALGFTGFGH